MIDVGGSLAWGTATALVSLTVEGYNTVEVMLWSIVLFSGILGAIGAGYLLYVDTIVVHYTKFFRIIALGLLLFVATAPVVFFFAAEFIHGAHALAAAVVSFGLYTLIRSEMQSDDFEHAFFEGEESIPEMPSEEDFEDPFSETAQEKDR